MREGAGAGAGAGGLRRHTQSCGSHLSVEVQHGAQKLPHDFPSVVLVVTHLFHELVVQLHAIGRQCNTSHTKKGTDVDLAGWKNGPQGALGCVTRDSEERAARSLSKSLCKNALTMSHVSLVYG